MGKDHPASALPGLNPQIGGGGYGTDHHHMSALARAIALEGAN
jgi:hypothetical protein